MRVMNNFNGYKVFENPHLSKTKTTRIDKPWWMRLGDTILRWNPCNNWDNPDYKIVNTPSNEVIISGNDLYMHPEAAKQMRDALRRSSFTAPILRPEATAFVTGATV